MRRPSKRCLLGIARRLGEFCTRDIFIRGRMRDCLKSQGVWTMRNSGCRRKIWMMPLSARLTWLTVDIGSSIFRETV
ncbi:hypothetical protein DM02DRAFT_370451 [Periconia macrospinosa]|uniref:Uncharacterized protein n=1 Tax=Periconia macrospinosa TaxID=97972 RepID=A0A2V1DRN4_9PLEO|nr:hypothetical protein DM02DRAFT_370451 [Periconia macrospinosa]